jgi:hypothetical protein
MMEAVHASETSVNFNVTTLRYIPEDSKLRSRRREQLKSHNLVSKFVTQHVRGKTIPSYIVIVLKSMRNTRCMAERVLPGFIWLVN